MVRALHEAGIEVILDVVYNHTAEGNHLGPTLSFRGIDNAAYYRLVDDDPAHYYDTTGTGQQPAHAASARAAADHGLAALLGHRDARRRLPLRPRRHPGAAVPRGRPAVRVLRPRPAGPGHLARSSSSPSRGTSATAATRSGNFPPLWTEWNGKYRDTVRDFWRGEPSTLAEFASRITGSSDLYQDDGRHPIATINFVTAHDGFTLRDLVSYNEKHNEANGEGDDDGESHNRSWNCGVEGETDDEGVIELRDRQQRNFLTTLLLSQGVPMILHGDEIGPHPARQQQRLLPGQRDVLDRLDARRAVGASCSRSPGGWSRCGVTIRCSGAAGSSRAPRPRAARARSATSRGSRRTARRCSSPTGRTATRAPWRCSSTASGSRSRTSAASRSSTTPSWCSSTPTSRTWSSRSRRRSTAGGGRSSSTPRTTARGRPTAGTPSRPVTSSSCLRGRRSCSAGRSTSMPPRR